MYSTQPKNINPKPGFQPLVNPGFGFGKMAGFPQGPGFSKPGFQSLNSTVAIGTTMAVYTLHKLHNKILRRTAVVQTSKMNTEEDR